MGRRTLVVRSDSQADFAIRAGHHDRRNAQTRILQLEGQYEGNMETHPHEAAPLNPFKPVARRPSEMYRATFDSTNSVLIAKEDATRGPFKPIREVIPAGCSHTAAGPVRARPPGSAGNSVPKNKQDGPVLS